ncbi:MAG: hypothetical protein PVJ73_08515 [Acidobacteriota bacterium]
MSTLLLALMLGGILPSETRDIGPLADLELHDQYGREDSLRTHRGQVVLVTVVHAKRLRKLQSWEKALRERLEGVHYMRVADVPADPPVTHDEVAEKLRQRVPEEVSILIDLERRWALSLDLDTGQPNLLIFDRRGRLVSSYRGGRDRFLEAYVSRDLDRLLEVEAP